MFSEVAISWQNHSVACAELIKIQTHNSAEEKRAEDIASGL